MPRVLGVQPDVDAELVAALRRDDADAAVQLVERYGERVYRLAARITGKPDDAEEAAQSALATVVRSIDELDGEISFGAWVDRLAARAAYRRLLTRPWRAEAIALADVLPALDERGIHFEPMLDWSDRVEARGAQGELRRALTDALDALPADYRVALVLHDVERMADADIAEVLGVGEGSVRTRVHRARLFVRKRLSQRLAGA